MTLVASAVERSMHAEIDTPSALRIARTRSIWCVDREDRLNDGGKSYRCNLKINEQTLCF